MAKLPTSGQSPQQDIYKLSFICTLIVKVCHLLPYERPYSWFPAMKYYTLL